MTDSVIIEARLKQMEVSIDASAKIAGVVENKVNDASVTDIEPIDPTFDKVEKSPTKYGASRAATTYDLKPCPQLKQLCEKMDVKGLLKFISENWKFLAALRDKVSAALQLSVDPGCLVLNAWEGFYPITEPSNQGNKKETGLLPQRRTYIMLFEDSGLLVKLGQLKSGRYSQGFSGAHITENYQRGSKYAILENSKKDIEREMKRKENPEDRSVNDVDI